METKRRHKGGRIMGERKGDNYSFFSTQTGKKGGASAHYSSGVREENTKERERMKT